MKILVINAGSSSLKYQLINNETEEVLAKGTVERIGIKGGKLTHKAGGKEFVIEKEIKDHTEAIQIVLNELIDGEAGVIRSMDEIDAVGHRVVASGEAFKKTTLVTDEVMQTMEEIAELAPLHNPAAILGVNACRAVMPGKKMALVFDTSFHQTMPDYAYLYAIDYDDYKTYQVRKYGAHGTSHKFVSQAAAEYLGKKPEELKIITCHLGNGSSISAVDGGKCMGISGVSSDYRDLTAAAKEGNYRAQLALNMFSYACKKYVGSYMAALGGLDVIVFTAGVGENTPHIRAAILKDMEFFGIEIDEEKNNYKNDGAIHVISKDGSRVKVLVIPTNEELVIARETAALL